MSQSSKRRLRVITNSEIRTRRRCAREHYFSYVLGFRSCDEAEALRLGTIWHLALEAWWTGKGLEAAIEIATTYARDLYEAAKLRVMLRGYDARWSHESYEVLGVEEVFTAPLVNPETGAPSRTYALGGKLDLRFTRDFMEHKTSSEDIGLGSIYRRQLTLDTQVSTYYAGARSLGTDPERCHYDVARKPALRPSEAIPLLDAEGVKIVLDQAGERVRTKDGKKWRETSDTEKGYTLQTRVETPEEYEARLIEEVAGNPDRYYQRFDVVRLAEEEHDAMLDAWQTAQIMREDERLNRHPRNPDACKRFGRMCDFFDVCTGVATLEDPARFVRLENVHPELATAPAEAAE